MTTRCGVRSKVIDTVKVTVGNRVIPVRVRMETRADTPTMFRITHPGLPADIVGDNFNEVVNRGIIAVQLAFSVSWTPYILVHTNLTREDVRGETGTLHSISLKCNSPLSSNLALDVGFVALGVAPDGARCWTHLSNLEVDLATAEWRRDPTAGDGRGSAGNAVNPGEFPTGHGKFGGQFTLVPLTPTNLHALMELCAKVSELRVRISDYLSPARIDHTIASVSAMKLLTAGGEGKG